jgi:molecular chaperone DnaK
LLKQKDADKSALDAKAEALSSAAQKLGELMYAQAQETAGGAAGAGGGGGASGGAGREEGGRHEEKVVDAEYTEVKDKK